MISFAAIVARARSLADMTAAEFDYELARPNPNLGAFGPFSYLGLAAGNLGGSPAAGKALMAQYRAEIDAMVERAKAKAYTGWSTASRGPIRYAHA